MGTSTHDLWGVGIGLGARLARAAERFEILGFAEPQRQRDRARETASETRAAPRDFQVRSSIFRPQQPLKAASARRIGISYGFPMKTIIFPCFSRLFGRNLVVFGLVVVHRCHDLLVVVVACLLLNGVFRGSENQKSQRTSQRARAATGGAYHGHQHP